MYLDIRRRGMDQGPHRLVKEGGRWTPSVHGFFCNKGMGFWYGWTRHDLPINFPVKFWKKMAGNSSPIYGLYWKGPIGYSDTGFWYGWTRHDLPINFPVKFGSICGGKFKSYIRPILYRPYRLQLKCWKSEKNVTLSNCHYIR